MPEILDKETTDFLIRFFGGTASALTQNAFAWYYTAHPEARAQFPFTRPLEQLPLWNDLIVGGISVGEALLGLGIEEDPMKVLVGMDPTMKAQLLEFGKGLRKFGEGGVLYSAPMLTRTTIMKNVEAPAPAPAAARRSPTPAGSRGRVIKL